MVNSLAVFCGSKTGANPLFISDTKALGQMMAARNIKLVYGGGSVGLMGAIADSVMENGGEVIGVIPELLLAWEQDHKNITELKVVPDMHVRKRMMYELCDAAVILPGGNGTLDELFEMLTWNTLKIHSKKILLLNSAGYYNHLIAHINTMQQAGFLYDHWQERLIICDSPEAIFAFLDADKM
ncbi:TIGR00730 family Rossman fold protein [Parasediminibacterium paludis]|uniref:Cytokinin riboside 5'-monophosphate phosphoribohydrolase n=1 Tax=Parasediminibacterium paludis TaxID=908966 RepID=A0ABV8PU64_9BACT